MGGFFTATEDGGNRWYNKVNPENGNNLEDNFIQFASAGNAEENENSPAYENSTWNYAALGPNMDRNLENTFAVENRLIDRRNTDPTTWEPGCLSETSYHGGSLSALGTGIFSIGGNGFFDGQDGTSRASGSSMSAPQAAGTAAYMLAVNPSLEVSEVVDLIEQTAREGSDSSSGGECNSKDPVPSIDTYDAVLAAGGEDAREVLSDVTKDDRFGEDDIEVFLDEWSDRDGSLDYSRYDLNGNGQTGGSTTGRFDLNQDVDFGTVTRTIDGKSHDFDESDLTDREILCYYAYSDLYAGDANKRSELLPSCGGGTKYLRSWKRVQVLRHRDGVRPGYRRYSFVNQARVRSRR